jgi:hypothetical protein
VEKLMSIGDVVSEVSAMTAQNLNFRYILNGTSKIHPWASLAWSILSVIPRVRLWRLIDSVSRFFLLTPRPRR